VPKELYGIPHIKTYGDDEIIVKDAVCFAFAPDVPVEIYMPYPLAHLLDMGYDKYTTPDAKTILVPK
jgi:hypothetical protein